MMKKDKEHDQMAQTNDQTAPGRVKQICQSFLIHSDSGLAHRLQEEEFAVHYDRNRTHRHESQLGVKTARNVEEEEKQVYIAKKLDFYQQKQKLEEKDSAYAQQLQNEVKIQSESMHHHQNYYDEIEPPSLHVDTSSDEQLARILQEEEELLSSSSTHRSPYHSTFV